MAGSETESALRKLVKSPNNRCFGCGPSNPAGLQLQVEQSDGMVRAEFVPGEWHEGWEGVVHGGILAAALDEVMAYALYYQGIKGLTARMETRYRAPVERGDRLLIEARVVNSNRRLIDVEGTIRRDGQIVASATIRFMTMGSLEPEKFEQT